MYPTRISGRESCAAKEGDKRMSHKLRKTLCLVLVFALAFMLPVAGSAQAKKKTKKKGVKLSESKISLTVGKKKKIKVKNIKAKKVTRSENKKAKKIVKLSKKTKKGVTIKGLKKGKAVVTAKIKKGKKTYKKKVKVTVKSARKKTITISSIAVLNRRTIQVRLSGAQVLSAGKVTVKTKSCANGNYNRTLKIVSLTSADKKTWTITLDSESEIYETNYVQVIISGLTGSGTVSRQTVFSRGVFNYADTIILDYNVNDTVSYTFGSEGWGYSTYSVSGLPAGITTKMTEGGTSLKFGGKATKAGIFSTRVVAKDELKNTYTYDVIWVIGSNNSIAATYRPYYAVVDTDGTYYISTSIYEAGGSGSYNYEIQGNNYGLQVNSAGSLRGTLPAAGTYNIRVLVTDRNNASIRTTAVLTVSLQAGRTISGIVKDARGNPVPNAHIYFYNKNRANRYQSSGSTDTDSKGAYSIRLIDGTYEAYAYKYETESSISTLQVKGSRSGLDFTIPVYPITVVANRAGVNMSSFGSWTDDYGNSYGEGNKLYLKAGTYSLHSSYSTAIADYTGRINITVNAKTTKATAAITIVNHVIGNIIEDVPLNVTWNSNNYSDYQYYKFVPKTTGTYYFSWNGDVYEYIRIYLDNGVEWTASHVGEAGSFSYECTAGKAYYLRIYSEYEKGSSTFTVSKTSPDLE